MISITELRTLSWLILLLLGHELHPSLRELKYVFMIKYSRVVAFVVNEALNSVIILIDFNRLFI